LFEAAKSLRDSGYDGPFIGSVTEELFGALNAIEADHLKNKSIVKLVYQLDCNYKDGKPEDNESGFSHLWIATKDYWEKHQSFSKAFVKAKIPHDLQTVLHEGGPSWFYFGGTNKELQELMYFHRIVEVN